MDQGTLSIFTAVVASIVLEAAPFLLVGSLLSALIGLYVGDGALTRICGRSLPVQILLGLGAGMLLPTCECGVVPVTRRLLRKGVPPGAAITFMFAAPVLNPVCLASTWVAFQGDWRMAAWRAALVAAPAAAMGWVLGRTPLPELLRPGLDMAHDNGCTCGCGHDHSQDHGRGVAAVLRATGGELLDMGQYLILGALIAGTFKVFLPQEWLGLVSGSLWLAVPAMMLLAVLMSICSEADAFVAASLSMFPRPALLAFLALGPMLDLKLLPAFLSVFRRHAALALIVIPAACVFVLVMSLGLAGVLP
jgi:uncharacterized membrane protein YraQ (UPF0718 family)